MVHKINKLEEQVYLKEQASYVERRKKKEERRLQNLKRQSKTITCKEKISEASLARIKKPSFDLYPKNGTD